MIQFRFPALFVLFWSLTTLAAPSLPDMLEKALPGVVNISSTTIVERTVYAMDLFFRRWGIPQQRKQSTLGSGFVIDSKNGYVITNHHVVNQATEVVVILNDKSEFPARIIGSDAKLDLALLKMKPKKNAQWVSLPTGNSEKIRIGETVVAVGNPFGLQHTVTKGIISAKHRTIGIGPFDNFLQTDASINPGNSGGPLINENGEVVGVNTVIYSKTGQSGGLGFAIPMADVMKVIPDLKKYGRVPRPWLGILGQRLTPQLAQYYGLGTKSGVIIYEMRKSGPAGKAGVNLGDVILSINGKKVSELHDIDRILGKFRPGSEVQMTYLRGKKKKKTKVKLEELPHRLEGTQEGIL